MKFRSLSFRFLCLLVAAFPAASLFGALGDTWEWMNPLPQGNALRGAATGGAVTIAVGDNGTVITSSDGATWSVNSAGVSENLHDVAWGENQFVAAGENGVIVTSPNGSTWTPQTSGVTEELNGVAHGSAGFVAVGVNGTILHSADGSAWETQSYDTTAALNAVAFGDGLYVAVGASGTIVTSPDGTTWTDQTSPIPNGLNGVNFVTVGENEPLWVAVGAAGALLTSPDGTTWTQPQQATLLNLWDVTAIGEKFVAVGELGLVVRSEDGVEWSQATSGFNTDLYAAAQTDAAVFAFGIGGTILTSEDGTDWTKLSEGHDAWLLTVGLAGDRYIAAGTFGRLYVSPDGTEWTQQSAVTSQSLWDVAHGTVTVTQNEIEVDVGRSVVVGNGGTIRYSDDGGSWNTTTSGTNHHLSGLTFGNGEFVAVGRSGTVLYSADGQTWLSSDTGDVTDWLEDVIYTDKYVIVGRGGQVLTSTDPTTGWTEQVSGVSTTLRGIAFGAGLYIAVGDSGTILSSTDAETWQPENSGVSIALNNVVFGNNLFVAVGNGGTILTSPDGITWTIRHAGTSTDLWGIAAGPNAFIATGDIGVVLRSSESQPVDGILYNEWTVAMGIPAGKRGIDDTPADDGIANLVKFALGLDPLVSERHALPQLQVVSNGGGQSLALLLTQATDIYGAVLALEVSTDLVTWQETAHTLEVVENVSENLRLIRLVENAVFQDGDRRFIRLKVTLDETPPAEPEPDTFEGWVTLHSLPAGESGPLDNPAGDGIANLLKYAMGIDPWTYTNGAGLTTQTEVIVGDDSYMALVFARSTTATGIEFILQGSDDLVNWVDLSSTLSVLGPLGGDREEVQLTDTEPKISSRRFIRLLVQQVP